MKGNVQTSAQGEKKQTLIENPYPVLGTYLSDIDSASLIVLVRRPALRSYYLGTQIQPLPREPQGLGFHLVWKCQRLCHSPFWGVSTCSQRSDPHFVYFLGKGDIHLSFKDALGR